MVTRRIILLGMVKLSRKRREIEERERQILEQARAILLERGYLGLTMDRVARATEVSKGTVYQHFACKEEILIALSIKVMDAHRELFERGATFPGRPRERMVGIGVAQELFVRLYPEDFRASLIIKTASIRGKTSVERQARLKSCEQSCISIGGGLIRDAIAQGDLTLPRDTGPETLIFALWSLSFGGQALVATDTPLAGLGIDTPYEAISRNCHAIMDGYQWKPLFHEWDYQAVRQRICEQVFAKEMATLQRKA